ncbi:MAG TPA: hypothetical protein VN088_15750 [Nocardioides sp.]|nr:hypothetical protein [Nocardioides sp.]
MFDISLPVTEGGLIALIVILVLTGWLVPRRLLQDARRESERWRQAYELERRAREQLLDHAQLAVETARTTTAVLEAVRGNSGASEGEPDATVVA